MSAIHRTGLGRRTSLLASVDLASAAVVAVLLFAVHTFVLQVATGLDPFVRSVLDNGFLISAGILATLLLHTAWREASREKRAMTTALLFFTLAQFMYLLGDVVWAVSEVILKEDPFPSLGDAGFFAYYTFAIAGVLSIPTARMSRSDWFKLSIDMAVVMISSALLFLVFVFHPLLGTYSGEWFSLAIKLLYPIFDLVLLWSIGVMLLRRKRSSKAMTLYACGVAVLCCADVIFTYQGLGGAYISGESVADQLFPLSILLVSLAAITLLKEGLADERYEVDSETQPTAHRQGLGTLLLPYLWVVAAFGVLVYSSLQPNEVWDTLSSGVVITAFGAIIVCVLARQALVLRENMLLAGQQNDLLDASRILARPVDLTSGAETVLIELSKLIDTDESYLLLAPRSDEDIKLSGIKTWSNPDRRSSMMPVNDRARRVLALRKPLVFLESSAPEDVSRDTIMDVIGVVNEARRALWPKRASTPMKTWAATPLVSDDVMIGVLFIGYVDERPGLIEQLGMYTAYARHAATAIENARLRHAQLIAAAASERSKLSRDLHDSVMQSIFSMSLGLNTARAHVGESNSEAAQAIDYALGLAGSAYSEMRTLVLELRSEALDKYGLLVALNRQARILCEREQITLTPASGLEPALKHPQKEMFYRVGVEAVQNAVKHARCTEITLSLQHEGDALVLSVRDNGVGFNPLQQFNGHIGLISMRERASECNARVDITSNQGVGSTIVVTLPHPNCTCFQHAVQSEPVATQP
jgi:signal transduction histidine kinase